MNDREEKVSDTEETLICSTCGLKNINPKTTFCSDCGSKLSISNSELPDVLNCGSIVVLISSSLAA